MITLRDYQQQSADEIRIAYRHGYRAPLLVAPTGSGKTVLFSYIAHHAAARSNNVLILVHRQELLTQTSRTLGDMGVDHGLVARGMTFTRAKVQVASVQTLVRRMHRMQWQPSMIVVDEAHHATGKTTWGKVLQHYSGAFVLGVTATPERLDGQGLGVDAGGFFDALVLGPSVSALVGEGYLSQPVVYAPATADLSAVHTRMGDYVKSELSAAMDRPTITGDACQHYRRHCHNEPAIAFCCSVAHAENVAEQFRAAGYQAASIDGKLDGQVRRQRIADLADGQLHVLTSCEIISEGVDIPVVSAAILLRPTQSLGLSLQQMGRALRPHPGKERALILDHAGNCLRHGLPDDDREWSLAGGKRSGRRTTDEPNIPIRQCERCYHVHRPAPACPKCGFVYEVQSRQIDEVEGELQQVDPKALRRSRAYEERQARTYKELVELGKTREYNNPHGWANRRMVGRAKSMRDLIDLAHELGRKNPEKWAGFLWQSHRANRHKRAA